jgi:hypothetical protein
MFSIKSALLAGLALSVLPACHASPVAAPLVAPVAAPVSRASAEAGHVRRVLDVSDDRSGTDTKTTGGIWGINFGSDSIQHYQTWVYYRRAYGLVWDFVTVTVHVLDYNTSGAGEFKYLGNARVLYTVPDDQALVINEISGGNVRINGLNVGAGETKMFMGNETSTFSYGDYRSTPVYKNQSNRITVSYVFAPGDQIAFTADAGTTVTGYTADPKLFAGQVSMASSK